MITKSIYAFQEHVWIYILKTFAIISINDRTLIAFRKLDGNRMFHSKYKQMPIQALPTEAPNITFSSIMRRVVISYLK